MSYKTEEVILKEKEVAECESARIEARILELEKWLMEGDCKKMRDLYKKEIFELQTKLYDLNKIIYQF